jgi:2-keto-3-deoxy-galactonokinase
MQLDGGCRDCQGYDQNAVEPEREVAQCPGLRLRLARDADVIRVEATQVQGWVHGICSPAHDRESGRGD